HLPADAVADHEALEVAGLLHGDAVDIEDEVLVTEPGCRRRAALDHLDDLDAEVTPDAVGGAGRERTASAGDAEVGAPETPLAHEGGDDAPGRVVDRHGQAEADARDGGVDADQPTGAVDEGTARVAGVEGGVGLDDVLDEAAGRACPRGE